MPAPHPIFSTREEYTAYVEVWRSRDMVIKSLTRALRDIVDGDVPMTVAWHRARRLLDEIDGDAPCSHS